MSTTSNYPQAGDTLNLHIGELVFPCVCIGPLRENEDFYILRTSTPDRGYFHLGEPGYREGDSEEDCNTIFLCWEYGDKFSYPARDRMIHYSWMEKITST